MPKNSKLAPIVVFVYNRKKHTQKTIEALTKNKLAKDSELIIFSDAPKSKGDESLVKEVRSYLNKINGFKTVKIIERKENFGLRKSLYEGITSVLEKYEKIIILEDDLVVSKYFLEYMNDALELYSDEKKVGTISAYAYPLKKNLPDTYFLKVFNSWGWGTWKRAWKFFEADSEKLLSEIRKRNQTKEFDLDGSRPCCRMLKSSKNNRNSIGISWYASIFLQGMLTLCPSRSLVKNIGFDNSGVNCDSRNVFDSEANKSPIKLIKIDPLENKAARNALKEYFNSMFFDRLKFKLKKTIKHPIKEIKKIL